jgi:predicted nucleic acid-binding protein
MIYLDASVLFSLHFRDSNTVEALHLIGGATGNLIVSVFCEMETVNAFALRVFRNEMTELNMVNAVRDLESDLSSGFLQSMPIPEAAFARAKALAQKITPTVGVRAADLLHLAAAFEIGAKSLYTFDQKQHAAARAAGLAVNQLPKP